MGTHREKLSKTVLVVVAHPDDEVLGCGGTILNHVESGDSVHLIVMADGETSRNTANLKDRDSALGKVKEALKIESYKCLKFPDNRLDSVDFLDVVKGLEAAVEDLKIQPNIIYTHHFGDLNIDHQLTHKAVMTAFRPLPNSKVESIYSFETVSSTEWTSPSMGSPFLANYFVDISKTLEKKMQTLKLYENEMRAYPHARSYENVVNLAKSRGSSVGVNAAEAFVLERGISF
jgi:LmbE family N-acetylglucosaminyl deacetylase